MKFSINFHKCQRSKLLFYWHVSFLGRRYNTNYSNIFPEFLLRDLAKHLPVTLDEVLQSVSGVTSYKLDRYKQEFIQFLDITMKYTAILASKLYNTIWQQYKYTILTMLAPSTQGCPCTSKHGLTWWTRQVAKYCVLIILTENHSQWN